MFSNPDSGHVKNVVSHGENPLSRALQNGVQETLLFAIESQLFRQLSPRKKRGPPQVRDVYRWFFGTFCAGRKSEFSRGKTHFSVIVNPRRNNRVICERDALILTQNSEKHSN